MDEWRERLLWSLIAAAIVFGTWALALAVKELDPPPSASIAPPPISNPRSVVPGYSYEPTVLPVTTAVPISGTPTFALVNDPCTNWMTGEPTVLRHPSCPTAVSAQGWMGR